jgi:hypothetical protein
VDNTARDGITVPRHTDAHFVADGHFHPSKDDIPQLVIHMAVRRDNRLSLQEKFAEHDLIGNAHRPPEYPLAHLDLSGILRCYKISICHKIFTP